MKEIFVVTVWGKLLSPDKSGVLWICRNKNLCFASRSAAKTAIKRSLRYSAIHGLAWEKDDYQIKRIQLPPLKRG